MTATIARCASLGVNLTVTTSGTLRFQADRPLPADLLAELRVHKADIIRHLQAAAAAVPAAPPPAVPPAPDPAPAEDPGASSLGDSGHVAAPAPPPAPAAGEWTTAEYASDAGETAILHGEGLGEAVTLAGETWHRQAPASTPAARRVRESLVPRSWRASDELVQWVIEGGTPPAQSRARCCDCQHADRDGLPASLRLCDRGHRSRWGLQLHVCADFEAKS